MFGMTKRKQKNLKVYAACGCNMGRVRSNNEDNLFFNGIVLPSDNVGLAEPLYLYTLSNYPVHVGVFDGMGGEAHGELAAFLAATEVQQLPPSVTPATELVPALLRANEAICSATRRRDCGIMGTTAALLTIHGETACVTNIGDSRVYRLRYGVLEQLSTDHTDQIVIEQHGVKSRKPRLTQHLGIDPSDMVIEPSVRLEAAVSGDRYILCSDGLTDMVSEPAIANVLSCNSDPADCVNLLINMALENGGKDNVTVIVVAVV